MARFVGFRVLDPDLPDDAYITYVNPDHVVGVVPEDDENIARIDLVKAYGDAGLVVHGTPLEVATFLGEGRPAVMDV